MTPEEFQKKWARFSGKEAAAHQEHFNGLCARTAEEAQATKPPESSREKQADEML